MSPSAAPDPAVLVVLDSGERITLEDGAPHAFAGATLYRAPDGRWLAPAFRGTAVDLGERDLPDPADDSAVQRRAGERVRRTVLQGDALTAVEHDEHGRVGRCAGRHAAQSAGCARWRCSGRSGTLGPMPADLSTISIPADLLPADGRFGCGPSKVRPEAVAHLAEVAGDLLGTSHRQPAVRDQVKRVRDGLRQLFSLPADYEIAVGNGGATLFWDAAVFSLIQRRSAHAVFGEFSSKFAASARLATFLEDPVVVESPAGSH